MLIKEGLGNEVFLKVKIWEIFTFRRKSSIDLFMINVNLRYMYPARYLRLLFLRYSHNAVYKPSLAFLNSSYRVPSVVAGAIVLSWTLHCALRESDGRIKDEPK